MLGQNTWAVLASSFYSPLIFAPKRGVKSKAWKSQNQKKTASTISLVLFCVLLNWYLTGSRKALEYKDYIEIVEAIGKASFESNCIIDLKIKTERPWGWTPTSTELSIEKDGVTVTTSTSKYFKSDRIEQSPNILSLLRLVQRY
ncbi:hypothetical protein KUC14_21100 [Alteromonas sp. KC14]|nr:hypothetical protein KUC14_21100 [Alteromonas sp. KC14]